MSSRSPGRLRFFAAIPFTFCILLVYTYNTYMNTRCPVCKKQITWEESPYRPFCSYRCKMIDLGKWLNEEYRIQDQKQSVAKSTDDKKKN